MSKKSKNQSAWEKIFKEDDILKHIKKEGFYRITATRINQYRQARLMAKFDNSESLPEIFKENHLSILPIVRGDYIISDMEVYQKFPQEQNKIQEKEFPKAIQSLNYQNIHTEAIALNCVYITGILEEFLGEKELVPTVNGRMGSGDFDFEINKINIKAKLPIEVKGVQIEIDGAYEGKESLVLVEAKNHISKDFMVRQLYYPYRAWKQKLNKPIRMIYLVYSNKIFNLYEYAFQEDKDYNSLKLMKSARYIIEEVIKQINISQIITIMEQIEKVEEPEIPFPQADCLERIINLCELLKENPKNSQEITKYYDFDARQTDYYTNAGRYLGLIQKIKENRKNIFSLTQEGNEIMNLSYEKRQLELVGCILKHEIFKKALQNWLEQEKMPSKAQVVSLMKESNLYQMQKQDTYQRRASTIIGWIQWILKLPEETKI